jgi:hypothetical protein
MMAVVLRPRGPSPEDIAAAQAAVEPLNPDYNVLLDDEATPSMATPRKRRPMPGQGQGMRLKPSTSLGAPAGMAKGGTVRGAGCATKGVKKCKIR